MQEEVTNKTVTFVVQTTKFSANIVRQMMEKYLRSMEKNRDQRKARKQQAKLEKKRQPPQGRIRIKELAKQNAGMVNIEITDKNIKSFERYARKYGINYALKKDKTKEPPVYLVFFKARDQDAINSAFREYTSSMIKKKNRSGIHKKLAQYRAAVKSQKRNRVRKKQQNRER